MSANLQNHSKRTIGERLIGFQFDPGLAGARDSPKCSTVL